MASNKVKSLEDLGKLLGMDSSKKRKQSFLQKLRQQYYIVTSRIVLPHETLSQEDTYSKERDLSQKLIECLFPEGRYSKSALEFKTNPFIFFRLIPPTSLYELQNTDRSGLEKYLPEKIINTLYTPITPELELSMQIYNVFFPQTIKASQEDIDLAVKDINTYGAETIFTKYLVDKIKETPLSNLVKFIPEPIVKEIYSCLGINYEPTLGFSFGMSPRRPEIRVLKHKKIKP